MTQPATDPQSWEVLDEQIIMDQPFVTVAVETLQGADKQQTIKWPKIYTQDYVNALVLNEQQEALILEGYKPGTGRVNWQIVAGSIDAGEDPLAAVQRQLLAETGYRTDEWSYLGSYVVDANRHVGVGHFFCAQKVRLAAEPQSYPLDDVVMRWVSLKDLRYALLDGRLGAISYATTVALALLTILK